MARMGRLDIERGLPRTGGPGSAPRRAHLVAAPIEGGVVRQVLGLVRFDPTGPSLVVLPPWPGLDRAARALEAAGAGVVRRAPAPRPGGAAEWLSERPVDLVHVHYATPHDATPAVEAARGSRSRAPITRARRRGLRPAARSRAATPAAPVPRLPRRRSGRSAGRWRGCSARSSPTRAPWPLRSRRGSACRCASRCTASTRGASMRFRLGRRRAGRWGSRRRPA